MYRNSLQHPHRGDLKSTGFWSTMSMAWGVYGRSRSREPNQMKGGFKCRLHHVKLKTRSLE